MLFRQFQFNFYGAKHYSAKRGLAIACRPSVCLTVYLSICNVGWKSWKLIARTISPIPSLSEAQRPSPTLRGTSGNFGETIGGGKNSLLKHRSSNISETRKDREKVTMDWSAYRKSPTLFRTVGYYHSRSHTSSFP